MDREQLAAVLKRLKWNQSRAAEFLGVTRGAVSKWMSGDNPIPHSVMVALSLKCELTDGLQVQDSSKRTAR